MTGWAVGGVVTAYAGLLAYGMRLLLTGKLVPRSTLDDWISAYRISEAARTEAAAQTGELLQLARTNTEALNSIRVAAGGGGR